MLRFVLSAIALAGVLATVHPAFADTPAATASDHPYAALPIAQQSVTPTPASSSSPDATVPSGAERGKEIPVGFGWG